MTTLKLGEKTFDVKQPSIRVSANWRKKVHGIVEPILPELSSFLPGFLPGTLVDIDSQKASEFGIKIAPLLFDIPDLALELVYDMWPELKQHEDYILDNANDGQLFVCLLEAFKTAFPFGQILAAVPQMTGDKA